MPSSRDLLLRYITESILEEDYGAGSDYAGFGGVMDNSPYGMHYASGDQMYNVFIKPFVNVVGVAAGKTKELSTRAQALLKVSFRAMASIIIPVAQDGYKKIFDHQTKQLQKIKSEYSKIYDAVDAVFEESDIMVAAFAVRPDLFLTAGFVKHAPDAAKKILAVLSGGSLDNILDKIDTHVRKKSDGSRHSRNRDYYDDGYYYRGSRHNRGNKHRERDNIDRPRGGERQGEQSPGSSSSTASESLIREKNKEDLGSEDSETAKLLDLVNNKKIKQALADSSVVQRLTKAGEEVLQGTLTTITTQAKGILSAKSIQDMQRILGSKLNDSIAQLKKLSKEEQKPAEDQLMSVVKKSMKEFYVKQLQSQINASKEVGVPADHPYIHAYESALETIKKL